MEEYRKDALIALPTTLTLFFLFWQLVRYHFQIFEAQQVTQSGRPGRAELLAKGQQTDRLQNLAKLRRFRIGGGIGGRIIRDFRKMLHFGKILKKFGQIWRKFSKILANFANFWKKNSKNFSNF